ncbi:hypothetical protein KP509_19G042800 [Ceratopteris richardii]|uniref:tRNA (guanine(26)-N(2))-dimethyltransferase n=1 Tax=Ceratopteris richardii TaxID=49495 RepID=A0A8T2SJR6_CERRI|nr:hypothetical protein KP509_19G042800 [Ceratopteris richardii]
MWRLTLTARRLPALSQRGERFSAATCRLLFSTVQDEHADSNIIREGQAKILLQGNDVFYNKAQVTNRDLSIAVLQTFIEKRHNELLCKEKARRSKIDPNLITEEEDAFSSPGFLAVPKKPQKVDASSIAAKPLRILEATAASGLRAIRYALEVEGIESVVALDIDKVAVEACKKNIKLNGGLALSKVHAELGDARKFMLNHEGEFDVVDIDPYGSAAIFLDSAVQCVSDGGLLMCTSTDMAVLCGHHGEVCFSRYGSYSFNGEHCHEMAVRILLSSIQSHANTYKRVIVPVLSVSIDFYVRVFVRIYTSPLSVKESASKLSYVYLCNGCRSFHLQRVGQVCQKGNSVFYTAGGGPPVSTECKECGGQWKMGGPIWSESMHDAGWVSTILKDLEKSKSKFPAFDKLHCLLTAVSEVKLHAVKVDKSNRKTIGSIILQKEPLLQANFARRSQRERKVGSKRFLPNPEANWGPKPRAGRKIKVVENKMSRQDLKESL